MNNMRAHMHATAVCLRAFSRCRWPQLRSKPFPSLASRKCRLMWARSLRSCGCDARNHPKCATHATRPVRAKMHATSASLQWRRGSSPTSRCISDRCQVAHVATWDRARERHYKMPPLECQRYTWLCVDEVDQRIKLTSELCWELSQHYAR